MHIMSEVVPADLDINTEIARRSVYESFHIEAESIRVLGEGWDNLVFLINSNLVFRFPRRAVAIPLLQQEMSVLKMIPAALPLLTPVPDYLSDGCKSYPHPFYGHTLIEGTTGCCTTLSADQYHAAARSLALFLRQLHHPDVSFSAHNIIAPAFDRVDVPRMMATFTERLTGAMKHYDFRKYDEKIRSIQADAKSYKPKEKRSLVHGDLYHRHLIFDSRQSLSGIIDWGDCGISDPIIDLGVLFQFFPPDTHRSFLDNYGDVSPEETKYARFLGLYSAIAMLWYGHDRKDRNLIRTSLNTLEMI